MLSLSLLAYPTIDPVLIQVGPVAIRWYALAYIAGILLGAHLLKRLNRGASSLMNPKQLEDLILWAVAGIILGGRLGYVLFYKPEYYLQNLSEIPMIWHGGMAFHGGLIGVIAAFYVFAKRQKIDYLRLMDQVACAAPIGLFFGRVANFINGELFGRVSDAPWAMVFPHGGSFARHPSQLYQAALEGALLFVILMLLLKYTKVYSRRGCLAGVFLIGYGCARAFVELFREPDAHLGFLFAHLTMGQLLCVPMIMIGLVLVKMSKRKPA
jgi:phosphatidylglycerol:prolipoprotein diacylglycerol transferase